MQKWRAGMARMKGILFTVSTFMLLLTVLLFSMFYFSVSQEKRSLSFTMFGDRQKFLESDLGETYLNLIDAELDYINRSGNHVTFDFSSLYEISASPGYQARIADYESFLGGLFSNRTNIDINVALDPDFTINPYNISFEIDSDNFYIYTDSSSVVTSYSLTIQVDNPRNAVSDSGKPGHSGQDYPYINVSIVSSDNQEIIGDERRLDPASSNDPFYSEFDDDSRIDVWFGRINGRDGTLRVRTNELVATMNQTSLTYDFGENVFLEAARTYNITIGDITKNKLIIAVE
jgi:hypothetical protein